MLRKEAVVPEMIALLKELQSNSLFEDYTLVGGTALALQIGHRTSTDMDLFTPETQNAAALVDYFMNNYQNCNVEIASNAFIRVFLNGIKIEMVWYEEKTVNNPINEDGIRFLGINEIAAMKLKAITQRSQPRDFIDIAYLLKEIPLTNMFALYKEKFGSVSPLYMKRTLLVKSKNIKDNEWLVGGIQMLRHDIEPKDVPKFIEQAIEEHNKSNSIGIL